MMRTSTIPTRCPRCGGAMILSRESGIAAACFSCARPYPPPRVATQADREPFAKGGAHR